MEFLLNRYRNLTVLLVVIAAQLLLLAYQVKSGQDVRLVRVWAVTAVTPLARILEVVRRNTIGLAEDYFDLIHVRDENNRVKKEADRLKMENQFLKTELSTADRAQALTAFQSRTPSRTIAARIIGNGTGMNSKDVLIDRGSGSGVMRGMAVVTPDGIVGRVLASYPTASQVLLITDPTFAAGVISEKNRVHGTLKGIGQSKCIIDYVQNEEKVDVGEVFYTSGDDRVFPKGLPVGITTVVRPGKTFKEIYVVPSGTQNGLEEVLVVVEGIHQEIPDAQAVPSTDVYIMPAPPGDKSSNAPTTDQPGSTLTTDADRLREKYKKIGAAQGHKFGEGLPGAKPANFNLDPDTVKPPAPPKAPGTDAAGRPAAPSAPVSKPPVLTNTAPPGATRPPPAGNAAAAAAPKPDAAKTAGSSVAAPGLVPGGVSPQTASPVSGSTLNVAPKTVVPKIV
ncbi:MAG: rod shape-determining protein MreC, partial [Bryobacteraceae bacterium]